MSAAWYDDRRNLAAVARHMGDRGDTVEDVVYMLEKPQKFEDDWRGVQASHSVENEEPIVCAGCGATTTKDAREGWRITDAAWCPKCVWLA